MIRRHKIFAAGAWSILGGFCLVLIPSAINAENVEADKGVAAAPVFTRDIAPIFQKHCQECHRPGEIAPMSFASYEDVRPWAKSIREKVAAKVMPPWHAEAGVNHYANDRSLKGDEIASISRWVEAG